jgi:DNA (cytosine-5)-methyltransferase 1
MGYHRAGFDEIVGVDIDPQPDYPFEFHQADALEWSDLDGFDMIHASPPCQAYSALTKGTNAGREYPDLIAATRALIGNRPSVIENVAGAPIRKDVTLCGEMFGLGVIRHRYFELNDWAVLQPNHTPHRGRVRGWRHGEYHDGPYLAVHGDGGGKGSVAEWQKAMGIDWTDNRKSLAEAIPPAYTEWIGREFLEQCG